MEAAIFIFYLLVILYAVVFIPFFKNSGLSKFQIAFVFVLKVLAGIGYAMFYRLPKYFGGADTWRFYRLSLEEKKWLLSDPTAFIQDLFKHGYDKTGNLFAGENSYWNDLKSNVPVKIMACMNVITNNSYYTNIILFNFLFLFGLVALFKMFNNIYPCKKWLLIIGIFLLPSTRLDNCENDKELEEFKKEMLDRFGPIPQPVEDLFTTVRCRKLGVELGFEKMTLKAETLRCYFINRPDSPYFESDLFKNVLEYLQTGTNKARLKQTGKMFLLVADGIKDMPAMRRFLQQMHNAVIRIDDGVKV